MYIYNVSICVWLISFFKSIKRYPERPCIFGATLLPVGAAEKLIVH